MFFSLVLSIYYITLAFLCKTVKTLSAPVTGFGSIRAHTHLITRHKTVFILFLSLLVHVLLTTISTLFLFLKLSTVMVRRSQPARNPREGVLKESNHTPNNRIFLQNKKGFQLNVRQNRFFSIS